MVLTRTHGIDKDLWYIQGLMVLTTPMVLTETHGIESVLLNHTCMRGPSVTRMQDFMQAAGQTLPDATPQEGKIHPFSKIAVTFEPVMRFGCPSGF
jgi:hypothetical protein